MKENHIVSVTFNRNHLVIPNDLLPPPPISSKYAYTYYKTFPRLVCEDLLVCLNIKATP